MNSRRLKRARKNAVLLDELRAPEELAVKKEVFDPSSQPQDLQDILERS